MDTADPQEASRLQERYAQMTDEELQAVADEGYELTETAQQILQSAIRQRRLDIRLKDKAAPEPSYVEVSPDDFDPSDLDLVVAQRVWDQAEAIQVKGILNNAGIPCFLGLNNLEDVNAFNINFDKGVDLKIRSIDQRHAIQALKDSLPPDPEIENAADTLARCPRCHSTEIVFRSLDLQPGTDSAFDSKFNWSCDACGHQWKDDGIEQEA
jgi:DNA-directed RNA polymerase subunit M/transcription elongation factor TFIIS